MAHIEVSSDDRKVVLDIVDLDTEGETWTVAKCRLCGEVVTDRGHFEDTIRAAEVHADQESTR